MLIGFKGDLHGRVLHALALVATWQKRNNRSFDLLTQVGDMAAFPDMARLVRSRGDSRRLSGCQTTSHPGLASYIGT